MPKRKAEWQNSYIAKTYDRVNLTLPKGDKAKVQEHATARDESLNGFINRAIDETIQRDTASTIQKEEPTKSTQSPASIPPIQSKENPTGIPKFKAKSLLIELERGYKIDPDAMNIGGDMLTQFQASGVKLTEDQRLMSFDGIKLMKLWQTGIEEEHVSLDWLMHFVVKLN